MFIATRNRHIISGLNYATAAAYADRLAEAGLPAYADTILNDGSAWRLMATYQEDAAECRQYVAEWIKEAS